MKIKNILVAIDIDDNSDNIIDFALEIAINLGATVHFIHTIKPNLPDASQSEDDVMNEHSQTLEEMVLAVANDRQEELSLYFHISHGFAEDRILEKSLTLDSDLIVMGIRQDKLSSVSIFPGISLDILNRSVIPVIFVPEKYKLGTVDSILFTIDFKFEEINAMLDALIFARKLDAVVTALHICEKDESSELVSQNLDIYERLFKNRQRKGKVNFIAKAGEVVDEVVEYIKSHNVDILCLMVHKQKPLERIFKVSTANKLARRCPVPFMVMHPEPKRISLTYSEVEAGLDE